MYDPLIIWHLHLVIDKILFNFSKNVIKLYIPISNIYR